MLDSIRAAAAGVDSKPGETESNLSKIAEQCQQAAGQGARLVLFPELSVTGFVPNHPTGDHEAWLREALAAARDMALPIGGKVLGRLAELAADTGLYVSAGLLEDAGNTLYNTQALVGPQGLLGAWRKMHIPMFEAPFYNGGPAPEVVETPLGRIGVNICFDALLPESTRLLAVQDVEIVLFPFAADPPPRTPDGWAAWAGPALRARCRENGVFGLAVNYVGEVACAGAEQRFPGGGMALDPQGRTLAEWPSEPTQPDMLLVDLRRETLQTARADPEYLFRFRRPELYGSLAKP